MVKKCVPLLILLLAAALNTFSLARYERFHPDEAFFMTFARNAAVNGDWWLSGPLDKPPLTMYLNALALKFFAVDTDEQGVFQLDVYKGELAGRIPGLLIGVLLVAVMIALARALYHNNRVAWLAGLLLALAPYTLAFSPTAFTDLPMLLFAVVSVYAAVRGRPVWSGVWFILACACKPQAIYFLPLLLFFNTGVKDSARERREAEAHKKNPLCETSVCFVSLRFIFSSVIGGVILIAWDAVRPGDSVFVLGAVNNAPETFIAPPETWLPRLAEWAELGQYLGGNALTTGVWLIVSGRVLLKTHRGRSSSIVLLLWLIGYSAFHLITASNLYDRYLLPLLPVFALLTARGAINLITETHRTQRFHTTPAQPSSRGGRHREEGRWHGVRLRLCVFASGFYLFALNLFPVPIGGDRGDYRGIDALANYLNAKPVATVIYDRWLGWEMGYYMGQWTNKRRVYYPTPEALAAGALALPELGTRYLIAPDDVVLTAWIAALETVGFEVQLETQIARFQIYALSRRS